MLTDEQKAEQKAEREERKERSRARYFKRHNIDVMILRATLENMTAVIVEAPTKASKGSRRHRRLLEKSRTRFHSHVDVRGGYGWHDSNGDYDDLMRGNKPNHAERVLNVSYMPIVPNWGHKHDH